MLINLDGWERERENHPGFVFVVYQDMEKSEEEGVDWEDHVEKRG